MSATIDADTRTPGSVPRILQVGSAWGWRFLVVVAAILTTGWLLVQLRVVIIPVFVLASSISAVARRSSSRW